MSDRKLFFKYNNSRLLQIISLLFAFFVTSTIAKSAEAVQTVTGKFMWHGWCGSYYDPECTAYETADQACQFNLNIEKQGDNEYSKTIKISSPVTIDDHTYPDLVFGICHFSYLYTSDGETKELFTDGHGDVRKHLICPNNSFPPNIPNNTQCECSYGFKVSGNQCIDDNTPATPPVQEKSLGQNSADTNVSSCQEGQFCGNPISNTTGNKYEEEEDYLGTGPFPLQLIRHYNSQSTHAGLFGANWSDDFSSFIQNVSATEKKIVRSNGQVLVFKLINGVWAAGSDVLSHLSPVVVPGGGTIGWYYTTGEDNLEIYDLNGQLITISNRSGLTQTLNYNGSRLASVSDPFGRTLRFTLDASNRITTVTDPAGKIYRYAYGAGNNLVSVTYPTGKSRRYLYEDTDFPHAMTGLIDENGVRFATWHYDAEGRAISSEHTGGAEKVTVSYDTANGKTTVTDALGRERTFAYQTLFGAARTIQAEKPSPKGSTAATATSHWDYDVNGNISSFIDYRGIKTSYTYDPVRNLETRRVEAGNMPYARDITTYWHPTFRLPTEIQEIIDSSIFFTARTNIFVYDSKGRLQQHTIKYREDHPNDPSFGYEAHTWNYQYNSFSQITKIDGPRTDVKDITQFNYDTKGNLKTITNALGRITQFTAYDANGRPLSIKDANGLVTKLTYDARGQLLSTLTGTELTTYTRDAVGQLTKVTAPDGSFIALGYDKAHRLVKITDQLGNHIDYTLDALGNQVKQETHDPKSNLTQTLRKKFDTNNRLAAIIGANGQTSSYAYDNNDNLINFIDPLKKKNKLTYDALNRLESTIDPTGKITQLAFNLDNNLIYVDDPLRHKTWLKYNALGNLWTVDSSDTGLSKNTYDGNGNQVTTADARGQNIKYSYDALNRKTKGVYGKNEAVTYTYDQGSNGVGHLTKMTDGAGTTQWSYDKQGSIASKTFATGKLKFLTRYTYDKAGRLTAITYPSGKVVQLSYQKGLLSGLSSGGKTLIKAIHYQPFGSAADWTFGNGITTSRDFDLDGRITAYDLGKRTRQLKYDAASHIVSYKDTDMNYDQSYTYDALNRLIAVKTPSTKTNYSYDANGNRTKMVVGSKTRVYIQDKNSNRLLKVTENAKPLKNYSYDLSGNIIGDGTNKFTYDGRNRLIKVTGRFGTENYRINGLGQRVAKVTGSSTYFVYDEAGHLLGEYNKLGKPIQETVWLDDMPVVVLVGNTNYYVYADHLNTPKAIADGVGKVIWRWDSDPFGATPANEDPDKDKKTFTYNLRFPGQYYDKSTGLHYNGFRDYDPAIGRYVQSDPIGLQGGLNTYSYVENNPLLLFDPQGLNVCRLSIKDKAAMGPKPSWMKNPHRHHIVMENAPKNWNQAARDDILKSQDILNEHQINKNTNPLNFTWAENQGHTQAYAKNVWNILQTADQAGGKLGVKTALKAMRDLLKSGAFPQ